MSTPSLPPAQFRTDIQVLRGFADLRDPGYSVLDVSIKLGYKTARIFSQHWVSVFGQTPARVRTRLTDKAAVESVLNWLGANGDDSALAEEPGHPPGRNGSHRRRRRRPEPS